MSNLQGEDAAIGEGRGEVRMSGCSTSDSVIPAEL